MTRKNKLRKARESLWLSQAYVASMLNITVKELDDTENGKRKPIPSELSMLSTLYGISADKLLVKDNYSKEARNLFKKFPGLTAHDKNEIANLLAFKRQMRKEFV